MNRAIIGLACLSVVIGIALATRIATQAGAIGAGYAAKQVCSGVFVARLPERFIVETDVLPRLATVSPLHHLLTYQLNVDERMVTARMLGQKIRVQHRSGYGCTVLRDNAAYAPPGPDGKALPPSDPSKSTAHLTPIKTDNPALRRALDRAFTEPPGGGRNTLAAIVMHRGEIVAERYQAPVTLHTPMQGWSMNKSLMATFIGQQIDRERLSLDDSVTEALKTAGSDASLVSLVSPDLTLGHLLSMTSGFDFAERYFPGDDVTDMLYRQPGMWLSAPATGHARPPGEQFAYSSGDINTASLVWQQSLEGQAYPDWIDAHFGRPLGIREMVLEPDASGIQVGSSYAYLTPRDWARMGQLWLDAWHGRSPIISQDWQRLAVTPGTANNGEIYGLGFWLNTGQRAFPSAPESTFHAGGNSGQFVAVLPERELVVVRLGLTLNESRADMDALLADVLAALP
jgi:CubicO group peptidase (beta-lactamase class C family)